MLISESRRFVFVHVQKTAGTSITEVLAPFALRPTATRLNRLASDLGLVRDWRRHHFRIHAPLRQAERILPQEVFESFYKFAFVRNPWDRLVSWYAYILQDRSHRRHRAVRRLPDFESFVNAELARTRSAQWWMLTGHDGRLGVDFVGRFENLERDMTEICQRVGIPYEPLPHVNRTVTRAPYQTYFTPGLARRVGERWAREIEAFGYTFED
jgi:hypothetical protein